MNREQEIKNEKTLQKRVISLPSFVSDFLYVHGLTKSIKTQIEYAKDLTIFFEYLIKSEKVFAKSTKDITIEDLKKIDDRDLTDFFHYLTQYEKEYETTTGKVIMKEYENTQSGKNRKFATLRMMFNYLLDQEQIPKNPMNKLNIKQNKTSHIKDRLNAEEIEILFSTIKTIPDNVSEHQRNYLMKTKERNYVIVLLLAYTGMRISELCGLDIRDVRLDDHMVIVKRKGGDTQGISLPDAIMPDIEEYIKKRRNQEADTSALFLSLQRKRLNDTSVRQLLKRYREQSGIELNLTPHVFRRTFATHLYNNNEQNDLFLVAEILGHRSAETTRKFYANASEERINKAMKGFSYNEKTSSKDENVKESLKKLADSLNISVEELIKSVSE